MIAYDDTTLLVAGALLLAAYVKGITGLGFPLIATPVIALLLDIRAAITILIIPNIVMDITQIFRGGLLTAIFRRFASLLLFTIVGVFLGTKILTLLPLWALNLTLGFMVLAFVASNISHFVLMIPSSVEKFLSPTVGFTSGLLAGMTNVSGPALAVYLYGLKIPKPLFVKSIATIFIVTKVSQLIAISTWDLFSFSTLHLSLQVTLIILVGFYAGLKTQDRVDQKTFNYILLVLLFVTGVTLIVRAVSQ